MKENHPVIQNAEEFHFPGNSIGVLISHGFTGTTQSMYYLGKRIAEQGYTVYGPRLAGHGTHSEDMEKATYQDWITNMETGLKKLTETCSEIFVAGLSMGGTLTLYLAERHPKISGIIVINAATELPDMQDYYRELINKDVRFVEGIGSDIKQEGIEELAYEQTPVKAMGELVALMDIVKRDLNKITAPAIIFSSTVDHVVPPENSKEIHKNISSDEKNLVRLENSYHVATLDHDKDIIADKCIAFINDYK